MKHAKKLFLVIMLLALCVSALTLAGCSQKYTIAFVTNGGSPVDNIVASKGTKVQAPAAPTKENYIFDGWCRDVDLEEDFTFPATMPAESFNLYARWKEPNIVLTFESNGGSQVNSVSAETGSKIQIPDDPIKTDYHFAGWYLNQNLTFLFDFVMPIKNTTVYAKWVRLEDSTSFEFNKNWTCPETDAYELTQNDGVTKVKALEGKGTYSLIGTNIFYNVKAYNTFVFTFTGTADQEVLIKCQNGGVVSAETKITMTGKTNQKYIWSVLPENLTDGQAPMNFYVFLRPGEEGGGAEIEIKSLKLYRSRTTEQSYESAIFFDTLQGSPIAPVFAITGADVSAPETEPKKAGYKFAGWYTDIEYETIFAFNKMPEGKTFAYARWQSNRDVVLRFDTNGGSTLANLTQPAGADISKLRPSDPTKADVIFDDWYTDSAFTIKFDWKNMPDDDATIYARWVVLEYSSAIVVSKDLVSTSQYLIVKNQDGTTTVSIDQKTTYDMFGSKLNVNAQDYGYIEIVFTGTADKSILFKCQNGGVTAIETKVAMTGQEQTVLWKVDGHKNLPNGLGVMDLYMCLDPGTPHETAPIPAISATFKSIRILRTVDATAETQNAIHFVSNGAYGIVAPIFAQKDAAITLPTPTKRGYAFEGWYTDAALQTAFNAVTMPAETLYLYAKWSADTGAITEYTFDKTKWGVVDGFNNYTSSQHADGAKIAFNHTENAWSAVAGASYAITELPADSSARYSKLTVNFKLLGTSIEGVTEVRFRFYSPDDNFTYNSSKTATFEILVAYAEIGTEKELVMDFAAITDPLVKSYLDGLLKAGNLCVQVNATTGSSAADYGTGELIITGAKLS